MNICSYISLKSNDIKSKYNILLIYLFLFCSILNVDLKKILILNFATISLLRHQPKRKKFILRKYFASTFEVK